VASWFLEIIAFQAAVNLEFKLIVTCYQQSQYELEKAVARSDDGFLAKLVSPTLPSQPGKKIAQKSRGSMKRTIAAERDMHTPKGNLTEKHNKYMSKNTYSKDS